MVEELLELALFEYLDDLLICALLLWVHVESERASEHGRILWDQRDPAPQVLKVYFLNVDAIDQDLAFKNLHDPAKGEANGALACSSSSNDADFLATTDFEGQLVEHRIGRRSVL